MIFRRELRMQAGVAQICVDQAYRSGNLAGQNVGYSSANPATSVTSLRRRKNHTPRGVVAGHDEEPLHQLCKLLQFTFAQGQLRGHRPGEYHRLFRKQFGLRYWSSSTVKSLFASDSLQEFEITAHELISPLSADLIRPTRHS